jgi:Domain of unknown function (DUF4430)
VSRSLGPLLASCLAAVLLAGCGLGAGPAPSAVHLTVTREFGATVVHSWSAPRVVGQETAMSLLMRNATVKTRYGGGFVESVDGLAGGEAGGQPRDWFYYVNGVEASKGATATNVHPGDHIWWDLHDWSQSESVPAVVGSFPEPFLNGIGGKRLPVRIECAVVPGYACRTVTARLRALGVPAAIAAIGSGGEPETLRVMVGPWIAVASDPSTQGIERGPGTSGVYARFSAAGQTLTLLNERGAPTRTLTAGTGLVAATRRAEDAPVWVVTGTDEAGVRRAAEAFDASALQDRFALAVTSTGTRLPVPGTEP